MTLSKNRYVIIMGFHDREEGRTIRAHVYLGERQVPVRPDRTYAWTRSGKLLTSQGGYSGKLLDGPFHEFYASKNLYVEGSYLFGLKQGVWKAWRDDGHLNGVTTWRRGVKDGPFTEYDSVGRPLRKGTYRSSALSGKLARLDSTGRWKEAEYRQGKVVPRPRTNIYIRIKRYLSKQLR